MYRVRSTGAANCKSMFVGDDYKKNRNDEAVMYSVCLKFVWVVVNFW